MFINLAGIVLDDDTMFEDVETQEDILTIGLVGKLQHIFQSYNSLMVLV